MPYFPLHLAHSESSVSQSLDTIFESSPASAPAVDDRVSVVLYGAGQLGVLAASFCQDVGIDVRYALDARAFSGQKLSERIPVFPVFPAGDRCNDLVLVTLVTSPFCEINRNLQAAGWKNVLPFYDYAQHFTSTHPLNNGWFSGALSVEDKTHITAVMHKLREPHSRAAYLQFLAWRVLRQEWCFDDAPVSMDDKYSIPQLLRVLTDKEAILDVGAYDGRFLFHLLEITKGEFSKAQMFEPDQNNCDVLRQNLTRLSPDQRAKIEVSSQAISNVSGTSTFSSGYGMTSRISPDGQKTVNTVRIDDLDLHPTYLKLHIEGAEMDALRGAVQTLQKCRPIIALTSYHNRDGMWKIPIFLMSFLEGYEFYFRLHNWCGTGAVFYAVPEREKESVG